MEVTVMAVTKMSEGFCIAALSSAGRWVRLIPAGLYNWRNLAYRNGEYIRVGDVLKVAGFWRHTNPPHFEDYSVESCSRINRLTNQQLLDFCRKHAGSLVDLDDTFSRRRSLCMVKADEIKTVYEEEDRLKNRVAVCIGNNWYQNKTMKPGFPCTCLRWRAMQRKKMVLPSFWEMFVVFGLTRPFTGESGIRRPEAPMIISIVSAPAMPDVIDYQCP